MRVGGAAGVIVSALLAGCGGGDDQPGSSTRSTTTGASAKQDDGDPAPSIGGTPLTATVDLRVRRADDSTYRIDQPALAWCGPSDWIEQPVTIMNVFAGFDPERTPRASIELTEPALRAATPLSFADGISGDMSPSEAGAVVFVTDPAAEGEPAELSSQEEESRGTLEVTAPDGCREGSTFRLVVDGTLGGENTDETVTVTGTVRGTIGAEPDFERLEAQLADEE